MIYWLQFRYWVLLFFLLPLFPVLIRKGKQVRQSVPKLQAPEDISGPEKTRPDQSTLLFLGESTIAGIGVDSHKEGIAGQTTALLSNIQNTPYQWLVVAKSGYRAREVLSKLMPKLPKEKPEIVVIGLGGNDTFRLTSPRRFLREMRQIVSWLQSDYGQIPIIITSLPPVALFPAFKGLPAVILGQFVSLLAQSVKQINNTNKNIYVMPSLLTPKAWRSLTDVSVEKLFSDGVHPSAFTYKIWGKLIADFIYNNLK